VRRRGYRTGLQVAHEFAVTQGAKSIDSLHLLVEFFGVGAVYINRRYDNHREHVYRFCVRKRCDLLQTIVPFFQQHPLRTSKQNDFLKFTQCLQLAEKNAHLSCAGLIRIAKIAETMNHRKPRTVVIRELERRLRNPAICD
jgi:LAGLIDADG endonuclease